MSSKKKQSQSKTIELVNSIKKGMEIDKSFYDDKCDSFRIKYKSGKEVIYIDITPDIFDDFNLSDNKVKYVTSKIVGKFRSQKLASGTDEEAFSELMKYMEPYLKAVCRKYYLTGKDYDDILQDARISLYKAAQDFDECHNISFENFAVRTCVKRRIFTEIKRSTERQKSIPLNTASSLDAPIISSNDDSGAQTVCDLLEDFNSDPLKMLIESEDRYVIRSFLDKELTELEAAVLEGYECGDPYKEIADKLHISVKCVDNSLGRIRKKASKMFDDGDESISTVIYRSKKRK